MNGFERHKEAFVSKTIPEIHLSPSTYSKIVDAPDVFIAEKLFGKKGVFGPAPLRGIVIEDAVKDVTYHDMKIDEAIKKAEDGIRDRSPSRGLGDVYKRQLLCRVMAQARTHPFCRKVFQL